MEGATLVIPLDSVLVWAEVYGIVAVVVWIGFMVARFAWAEPEGMPGNARVVRVVVSGFIVGLLWPLWGTSASSG